MEEQRQIQAPIQTSQTTNLTKSDRFNKPELDVLRLFAFLGIFFYHKLGLTHFSNSHALAVLTGFRMALDHCVSLFFFLSSYLITTLLEIEMRRAGTIHVRDFYIRRILRIWPLYYTFLLACLLFGLAFSRYRMSPGAILAYLFFSGNWFIVAHGWLAVRPTYGLLWSVCIEEQFYAVCPILVKFFRKSGLIILCLFFLAVSYSFLLWLGLHGKMEDHFHRTNFFVQVQFFAAGTLTALFMAGRQIKAKLPIRLALCLAGIIAWFVAGYWFDSRSFVFIHQSWSLILDYLLNLLGCVAIFVSFLDLEPRFIPTFGVNLGRISYGLYVYHLIIITIMTDVWHIQTHHFTQLLLVVAAQVVVALALTILIAKASYLWIEKPFLLLKERFTSVRSRPV